jgi:hypothetical protein
MAMNDDEIRDCGTPPDAPPANSPVAPAGLLAWLPWFAAASFALLAGFMLFSWFALRAEIAVLRDEATLAEIQGKTLRQQIEAEQILSARRLTDLRSELQSPRDLSRLEFFPLVSPTNVAANFPAVAVWDPDSQEGELVVWALPALAQDKSYQLWLFDSAHPAGTSLAVFAVDSAAAEILVPFKLNRTSANGARYKVSLERKGGASVPEGPVVLASN